MRSLNKRSLLSGISFFAGTERGARWCYPPCPQYLLPLRMTVGKTSFFSRSFTLDELSNILPRGIGQIVTDGIRCELHDHLLCHDHELSSVTIVMHTELHLGAFTFRLASHHSSINSSNLILLPWTLDDHTSAQSVAVLRHIFLLQTHLRSFIFIGAQWTRDLLPSERTSFSSSSLLSHSRLLLAHHTSWNHFDFYQFCAAQIIREARVVDFTPLLPKPLTHHLFGVFTS